jgi:hypothetical protein
MMMKPAPIPESILTAHARWELSRRGLSETTIHAIRSAPEQRSEVRPGRVVLQSKIEVDHPKKTVLVRIFVDVDRHPAEVVTAYRTSKIVKYWREDT